MSSKLDASMDEYACAAAKRMADEIDNEMVAKMIEITRKLSIKSFLDGDEEFTEDNGEFFINNL